ncbi:ribosome silencing factor [Desulfobotulus mexicanus]|uniref:Ribosomal silencing factor RsfS n=1 Tax=Desulfobotulus mexicanus TaxID=2586642 RepID=A0A5Q4VJE5_9BACT|nr:ribosome silencing factor [Desulfobotulus mexicanus]TYT76327.1 ribosome silencing factor [Desulfobotulus mexicanus]
MYEDSEKSLIPFLEAACARKAENIVAMDLGNLVSYADTFLVMSVNSTRQARAVADHMRRKLKEVHIKPLGIDGVEEGQWVLMDYGDVVIHIFHEPVRSFYDLEGLWADAPRFAEELIASMAEKALETPDPEAEQEVFWEWEDDEAPALDDEGEEDA